MKICFFGDSFTNGVGDDECLGWVGRVCSSQRKSGADLTAYNLGIRGNTSEDIMLRWRAEARARMAAEDTGHLVFSFGANDCAAADDGRARLAQSDRLKNARAILVDAPKAWPTLFVGPLPIADDPVANKRIADLSRQAGVFARAHRVPYLDVFTAAQESDVWQQECKAGDGVHPNSGGYELVAELVEKWDAWQAWFKG
jgi:acyl-CoA thioesterase-1